MDITIPRRVLLAALRSASRCVAKAGPAITRHALVTATQAPLGPGALALAATDLGALTATLTLACDVRVPGACAIDPALLLPAIETLPEGDLAIARAANGTLTIKTGRSKRTLPTSDAADFPLVVHAEGSARSIPVAALRTLSRRVAHAMSADETRPHLHALYLTVAPCELIGAPRPGLVAVATDGHRMGVCHVASDLLDLFDKSVRKPSAATVATGSAPGSILIPAVTWALLEAEMRALPSDATVTLAVDAITRQGEAGPREAVAFGFGAIRSGTPSDRYTTKLIDAAFPSWHQVMPSDWSATVTAKREELLASIDGALAVTRGKGEAAGAIVLEFARTGTLVVRSENPERGTAENELDVSVEGHPPRIGVKGEYLAQALKAYDGDTIALGLSGELDPIVVYDPGEASSTSRQVIMPMRV